MPLESRKGKPPIVLVVDTSMIVNNSNNSAMTKDFRFQRKKVGFNMADPIS